MMPENANLAAGSAFASPAAGSAMPQPPRSRRASYWRVLLAFARNSLLREMTFRGNFLINVSVELLWFLAMVVLFKVIYLQTKTINEWSEYEYFAFMATSMLIGSLLETFFLVNCSNLSELIRTGNLDFALLKPIDTQFLISLEKIDWSVLSNVVFAGGLLAYSLVRLGRPISPLHVGLYLVFVAVGVAIFYSILLALSSAAVWMGRHSSLQEFWFYVTIFARYPREIYRGPLGQPLYFALSYILPVLLVVNVPAQTLVKVFDPALALVALLAGIACLLLSRWFFQRAMVGYRSASS